MPNVMIGEEKVGGVTLCFDNDDREQMREMANTFGVKGLSAVIRLFLRAYENHPTEMASFLEEARKENRKIQSTPHKGIFRLAMRKGQLRDRQAKALNNNGTGNFRSQEITNG